MQNHLSSTVDEPESHETGKHIIAEAKLVHSFRDADGLQDTFENKLGQLTSEKLLEIAKAARSFQTPQLGYMLSKWIKKRYHANPKAVEELAQYWRDIRTIYLSYLPHTSCDTNDNAVVATLRVS